MKGIEPSYADWEPAVLPLNYTRVGERRMVPGDAANSQKRRRLLPRDDIVGVFELRVTVVAKFVVFSPARRRRGRLTRRPGTPLRRPSSCRPDRVGKKLRGPVVVVAVDTNQILSPQGSTRPPFLIATPLLSHPESRIPNAARSRSLASARLNEYNLLWVVFISRVPIRIVDRAQDIENKSIVIRIAWIANEVFESLLDIDRTGHLAILGVDRHSPPSRLASHRSSPASVSPDPARL